MTPETVPTLSEQLAEIRKLHREAIQQYAGGLPAEADSRYNVCREFRRLAQHAAIAMRCPRLDLHGLLTQVTMEGDAAVPAWVLVDPTHSLSSGNGCVISSGSTLHYSASARCVAVAEPSHPVPAGRYYVGAIPPIPPKVRRVINAQSLRRHVSDVLIVAAYDECVISVVQGDPALIVRLSPEDTDWYVLATWGERSAALMEHTSGPEQ